MSNQIKKIDIKEFREKGYLQEVNRRFFHPLGLALEVEINSLGQERLGGIWDYRNDPEGVIYGESVLKKPSFSEKAKFIESEFAKKEVTRRKLLGYFIQPA